MKTVAKFKKQEVIDLIMKMDEYNQIEQARATYKLANDTWPEWDLQHAPEIIAMIAKSKAMSRVDTR